MQLCEDKNLEVTLIGAVDGNQSLKRVRLREGQDGDPRTFNSNYYVPEAEVDELRHSISFRSMKTVCSSSFLFIILMKSSRYYRMIQNRWFFLLTTMSQRLPTEMKKQRPAQRGGRRRCRTHTNECGPSIVRLVYSLQHVVTE